MKGENKMKIISTFLIGCGKVLPLFGILAAITSMGVAIHEVKAKENYRNAKLNIMRAGEMPNEVVDAVDEADQLDEE